MTLQPGDRLLVRDTPDKLKRFENLIEATLHDETDGGDAIDWEKPLDEGGQYMAEIVITRGSPLHLRTLSEVSLGSSYGLVPLAVHRARAPSQKEAADPGSVRLRAGDSYDHADCGRGHAVLGLQDRTGFTRGTDHRAGNAGGQRDLGV